MTEFKKLAVIVGPSLVAPSSLASILASGSTTYGLTRLITEAILATAAEEEARRLDQALAGLEAYFVWQAFQDNIQEVISKVEQIERSLAQTDKRWKKPVEKLEQARRREQLRRSRKAKPR